MSHSNPFYAKGATFESKEKTQGQPTPTKKVSLKVCAVKMPYQTPRKNGKMVVPNLSVLRNLSVGHLFAGPPQAAWRCDRRSTDLTRQTGKLQGSRTEKKRGARNLIFENMGVFVSGFWDVSFHLLKSKKKPLCGLKDTAKREWSNYMYGPYGPYGLYGPYGPLRALRALTDRTGPLRAPYGHSGTHGPLATVQKLTSHEYYRVFFGTETSPYMLKSFLFSSRYWP